MKVCPGIRVMFLGVGACLGALIAKAVVSEIPLDIGVRTQTDEPLRPIGKRNGYIPKQYGKVYLISLVQPIKQHTKLVKPVDEAAMLKLFRAELAKQGFREVVGDEKPEIVLLLVYGRGFLANPYLAKAGAVNDSGKPPMVSIGGADLPQLMNQKRTGYEAKLQKASYEKLFIHVVACEYAPGKKGDPKVYWVTTINVDDPDHRDLNSVMKEMLAAGAPYFGKQIKEEEVDVLTNLPEGRVDVGAPTVVEPEKGRGSK